jgi:hypothetical protein
MMIHGLEVGDETVHEAERLNEVLNSNVRESLFCASFQPDSRGMMVWSSLVVRTLGFSIAPASVSDRLQRAQPSQQRMELS